MYKIVEMNEIVVTTIFLSLLLCIIIAMVLGMIWDWFSDYIAYSEFETKYSKEKKEMSNEDFETFKSKVEKTRFKKNLICYILICIIISTTIYVITSHFYSTNSKELYDKLTITKVAYEQALTNEELSTSKVLLVDSIVEFNQTLYDIKTKDSKHKIAWKGDYVDEILAIEPIEIY